MHNRTTAPIIPPAALKDGESNFQVTGLLVYSFSRKLFTVDQFLYQSGWVGICYLPEWFFPVMSSLLCILCDLRTLVAFSFTSSPFYSWTLSLLHVFSSMFSEENQTKWMISCSFYVSYKLTFVSGFYFRWSYAFCHCWKSSWTSCHLCTCKQCLFWP